jgi:hypothetical protein
VGGLRVTCGSLAGHLRVACGSHVGGLRVACGSPAGIFCAALRVACGSFADRFGSFLKKLRVKKTIESGKISMVYTKHPQAASVTSVLK